MTLDSTVYVLTARGISLAGIVGVFTDEQLARDAADRLFPQTDGYHSLDIQAMKLGVLYEHQFSYGTGRYDSFDPTAHPQRTTVYEGNV